MFSKPMPLEHPLTFPIKIYIHPLQLYNLNKELFFMKFTDNNIIGNCKTSPANKDKEQRKTFGGSRLSRTSSV